MYEITEDFLSFGRESNRPGTPLEPIGVTLHETATENATDENESKYFHNAYRGASAHYFVDYDSITQLIPENEVSWHAGYTANHKYLSVEMCHFNDEEKFKEVWNRTVWLVSEICRRYGFNPMDINQLNNHNWVSNQWFETDHTDPLGYFEQHGKTWDDFINDVKNLIEEVNMEKILIIINDKKMEGYLIDDKAYAPVRILVDSLNRTVEWNDTDKSVVIK
jgi:N-acetylmuramoyl-L-alanine amidase